MDFMYYFDFLRAIPRDYSSMTATFSSGTPAAVAGSGGRPGGPPAIKVKGAGPAEVKTAVTEDDYEE